MDEVEGCLTDHKDEPAALFEDDIGSPGKQRACDPAGDLADATHRRGGDEHAASEEGARRHRGADIADVVYIVGARVEIVSAEIGFVGAGQACGAGNDEVCLDADTAQDVEGSGAVDDSGRAGDADDETVGLVGLSYHGYS